MSISYAVFFFKDAATPEIYPLSLHAALPISQGARASISKSISSLRGTVSCPICESVVNERVRPAPSESTTPRLAQGGSGDGGCRHQHRPDRRPVLHGPGDRG